MIYYLNISIFIFNISIKLNISIFIIDINLLPILILPIIEIVTIWISIQHSNSVLRYGMRF